MRIFKVFIEPRHRLDVVAGLIDGMLNALVLTAGRLFHSQAAGSASLALKVGAATAVTTIFVFFVAHYAEARAALVHAEKQLNLLSHGHLATTQLGRQSMIESAAAASIAAGCGFAGSVFPLLLGTLMPSAPAASLAIIVVVLGALGALLARTFYGSPTVWAVALMIGGALLAGIGVELDIAG